MVNNNHPHVFFYKILSSNNPATPNFLVEFRSSSCKDLEYYWCTMINVIALQKPPKVLYSLLALAPLTHNQHMNSTKVSVRIQPQSNRYPKTTTEARLQSMPLPSQKVESAIAIQPTPLTPLSSRKSSQSTSSLPPSTPQSPRSPSAPAKHSS
jgi:hypothetical protein